MKILLVVAYLSARGLPHITIHERTDMTQCRAEATQLFNQVRVGTVRVWCARVAP